MTSLCCAIFNKHFKIVLLLLLEGASPFIFAKNCINPIDINGCIGAAHYMIKAYIVSLMVSK